MNDKWMSPYSNSLSVQNQIVASLYDITKNWKLLNETFYKESTSKSYTSLSAAENQLKKNLNESESSKEKKQFRR